MKIYLQTMEDYVRIRLEQSFFTDESERFMTPTEPKPGQRVTVGMRVPSEIPCTVCLILDSDEVKTPYFLRDCICRPPRNMEDCGFKLKTTTFEAPSEAARFYYVIDAPRLWKDGPHIYTRMGLASVRELGNLRPFWFCLGVNFSTPAWAKNDIWYQIFPDRFYNANESNDVLTGEYVYVQGQTVEKVKNWTALPKTLDVGRFYGGDLMGVYCKLDYLQSLGVKVLYLNPIFVSPSNHKYDCQDYDHVDPHLTVIVEDHGKLAQPGNMDNAESERYRVRVTARMNLKGSDHWFSLFVREIHNRGMRIILDGVFNHCGSFNRWFNREKVYDSEEFAPGAYESRQSPYHSYFTFTRESWPDNTHYDGWWNYSTLPKLNVEGSRKLCEEIFRIGVKWVSPPYCVDGWRLDVAADLGVTQEFNHKFWAEFRRRVKAANHDAVIIAEHYGDATAWIQGDQWDSVMNYDGFMEPVSWFFTGMEKHSDRYDGWKYNNGRYFFETVRREMAKMHKGALDTAMNELSNHDHSRFMTRTNRRVGRLATEGPFAANEDIDKDVFREACVVQFTWPGNPTIYYGDEAGLCGWTDPDNRRSYPWGKEDKTLINLIKALAGFREKHPALKNGSFMELIGDTGILAYARVNEQESIVVVVCNRDESTDVFFPVWQAEIPDGDSLEQIFTAGSGGFSYGYGSVNVKDGWGFVRMAAHTATVYQRKKPAFKAINVE